MSILCEHIAQRRDLSLWGWTDRKSKHGKLLKPLESLAGCQGMARGYEHGQRQAWGKFQVHSHVPALPMSPRHPAIPLGDELTFSCEVGDEHPSSNSSDDPMSECGL